MINLSADNTKTIGADEFYFQLKRRCETNGEPINKS